MSPDVVRRKLSAVANYLKDLDYSVLHNSIPAALRDFTRLIAELGK